MHTHQDFSLSRFKRLRELGYVPKTSLDIGANKGQWHQKFSSVFPETNILSIEGNPECENELRKVNPNYLICLLGKEKGNLTFYTNKNKKENVGGSIYKENTPFYDDCDSTTYPVLPLDSFNRQFDFIKMDVQGAELDIIKGGIKTIVEAEFLQLELSILKYNEGAPLISEVISYLHNIDFSVFDVVSHAYWNHRMNQVDMFFINNRKLKHLLEL